MFRSEGAQRAIGRLAWVMAWVGLLVVYSRRRPSGVREVGLAGRPDRLRTGLCGGRGRLLDPWPGTPTSLVDVFLLRGLPGLPLTLVGSTALGIALLRTGSVSSLPGS